MDRCVKAGEISLACGTATNTPGFSCDFSCSGIILFILKGILIFCIITIELIDNINI